ncbi:ATP-dependent protease subunit HslV [Diplonema papillatum]|nr:ATP-dependent protease subunit HslV [Diplonema papillatum]
MFRRALSSAVTASGRHAARGGWVSQQSAPLAQQKRNTTILCVRKGDKVVIMGDRQVTLGEKYSVKSTCKKLRRAGEDTVLVGFAGSTADAMTLLEKLEAKLTEFPSQLLRACVELAKEWRGDKSMRQLNASMIVANDTESLEIDGLGNVITPEDDGVLAIGSGGLLAKSAARALVDIEGMDADSICQKAMKIATSIDIYSNDNYNVDSLTKKTEAEKAEEEKAKKTKKGESLKVEPRITPIPKEATKDESPPSSEGAAGDSKGKGKDKEQPSKGGKSGDDKTASNISSEPDEFDRMFHKYESRIVDKVEKAVRSHSESPAASSTDVQSSMWR